jgi:hypothetical protein
MKISEADRQIVIGALEDSRERGLKEAALRPALYSPAQLTAVFKTAIVGDPNPERVCTSYIERANLTVRTHCKRLARLTLAFSKKVENFKAAIALHLAYYNFVKTHGSIRCTPAMEAGIVKSAWTVSDLVNAA